MIGCRLTAEILLPLGLAACGLSARPVATSPARATTTPSPEATATPAATSTPLKQDDKLGTVLADGAES